MITRVLSLPPSLTFAKFHRVLQIAFGWAGFHMHTFNIEIPTLRDVFEQKEREIEDGTKTTAQIQLRYEYDMGDGWDYQIVLLGRAGKGLHEVLGGRVTLSRFSASAANVICTLKTAGVHPDGKVWRMHSKNKRAMNPEGNDTKTYGPVGIQKAWMRIDGWDILEVNGPLREGEVWVVARADNEEPLGNAPSKFIKRQLHRNEMVTRYDGEPGLVYYNLERQSIGYTSSACAHCLAAILLAENPGFQNPPSTYESHQVSSSMKD
ncbi:MAG: hypothetical protein Q9176_007303 [Flavoplaca citrina]